MALNMLKAAIVASALIGITYADTTAVFCDDTNCSVNCGEAHTVVETSCQTEHNRNSIYFHTYEAWDNWALAWCVDDCDQTLECQNNFVPFEGCVDLSGNTWADSFSFRATC